MYLDVVSGKGEICLQGLITVRKRDRGRNGYQTPKCENDTVTAHFSRLLQELPCRLHFHIYNLFSEVISLRRQWLFHKWSPPAIPERVREQVCDTVPHAP